MVISKPQHTKTLQLTLYTGVALIVISMLFLGRQQQSASFAAQAFTVLVVPAFFYAVGALVGRYLHTPLAAPGLIGTGAWLVGVGLIHLYDQRSLLPEVLQPYYWFGASVLAGILISLTGHRVRIWMLVPLVPLVQTNAIWAIMGALGVQVQWMPALTFLLVLIWWEAPLKDERWTTIYRASGVLLTLFVLLFSLWLPLMTRTTLLVTWAAGAGLVAFLGLRHGWARMGPLTIIILACASIWGLSITIWPLAWVILALVTVIFIEHMTQREEKGKDSKTLEISEALAVLLSGAAALVAQLSNTFAGAPPFILLMVLTGAGVLTVFLGWRRSLLTAMHIGLWLLASAWAMLYFIAVPTSNTFGLWLALFASCALLVERLLASGKDKLKTRRTLTEAVVRWPVADLVIGLSAAIILWASIHILTVPPDVLAITCSIVVGLWIAAGLFYRLPILLHVALWIAPLPYALLLIIAAPGIWSLALTGFEWQLLGVIFLIIGHSLFRYRPAILAPFFIVGYVLVGFGFTMTAVNGALVPISLLLVILVCIGTSIAVIADFHPIWSLFVAWILPRHRFPYAYQHFNHLFLFLSAWLAAVWLHLILSSTEMPLYRQGVFLVGFAGLWFALGRALSRLPGVVGWTVSSAGWFMWLIGLIEVFFSPPEAVITMILGLVVSGEALRRSRSLYWIPIFIVQIFFTILQLSWMLSLSGSLLLMGAAIAASAGGMIAERRYPQAGRISAITGGLLALGVSFLHPDIYNLLALNILAIVGMVCYRRWQWLCVVYAGLGVLAFQNHGRWDWVQGLILGLLHIVGATERIRLARPKRYRTLNMMLFQEWDWASPILWVGLGLITVSGYQGLSNIWRNDNAIAIPGLISLVLIYSAARLPVRHLANVAVAGVSITFFITLANLTRYPSSIGNSLITLTIIFAALGLIIRWKCVDAVRQLRPFNNMRWVIWWLRPLLGASAFLNIVSLVVLVLMGNVYHADSILRIINALVLTAYPALIYMQRRKLEWLGMSVVLAGYTWVLLANAIGINSQLAYTLPVGLGLLALARFIRTAHYSLLEGSGTALLIVSGLMMLDMQNLLSVPLVYLGVILIGLAVYGYVAGRRIPFIAAGIVIGSGAFWMVVRVNFWLIPLGAGLVLLTLTILTEARGEQMAQWLQSWQGRWRSWK